MYCSLKAERMRQERGGGRHVIVPATSGPSEGVLNAAMRCRRRVLQWLAPACATSGSCARISQILELASLMGAAAAPAQKAPWPAATWRHPYVYNPAPEGCLHMQFALPSSKLSLSFGRPGSRGRKMASDGGFPRMSPPTTQSPALHLRIIFPTAQAAALPPPPPHAGCQPVEWSGRGGFTHLLHHPGFVKTETYGSASETERIGLRPPRCRRRPATSASATSRGHSSSSLLSLFVRARPGPAGAGGASGGQHQRQGRRPHRGVEGAGASGLCRRANAREPAACRRRCCHSSVALPGPGCRGQPWTRRQAVRRAADGGWCCRCACPCAGCPLQAQDESQAAADKPINDTPYVLLPGGTRMPLIGLGTYKTESPEAIRKALEGVEARAVRHAYACLPLLLPAAACPAACLDSAADLGSHPTCCLPLARTLPPPWFRVPPAAAVGYRHIDCATVYGNQALVGEGLKDFLAQVCVPGAEQQHRGWRGTLLAALPAAAAAGSVLEPRSRRRPTPASLSAAAGPPW